MAMLVKIILIFGFIIFLVSNSRAAMPTDTADFSSCTTVQSSSQYTLSLPAQVTADPRIRSRPLRLS